ncbi:hypothetical protein Lal_00036256 [Lupinus albus]|nr:hypothetical protein Lal_00036256 [Lupinus albus]
MKYKDVVNNIKGVPFDIRLLNQDAYTLKDIFIGPFHQHNPRLQNMERHKLIYFKKFLELGDVNLESLVIHVEEAEPNLRRSYADTLDLTKEELEKIILRFYYNEWSKADAFPLKPWLMTKIRLDLVLIENQLPFFVLESLYNRALISGSGNIPSFLVLTFDYFAYCNSCNLDSDNIIIRHFIDLLRMFHLQQPIERWSPSRKESLVHLNSASELVETGVKFKVNIKTKCLLDLKFSWGVLEIPQFRVEDGTKLLIHNLVALEQCHYPYESYITNYVAILDFHINSNKDVDALIENDVLLNCLGDTDSVTNFYNGLWKNITHLNFSSNYIHLSLDLNVFCAYFVCTLCVVDL